MIKRFQSSTPLAWLCRSFAFAITAAACISTQLQAADEPNVEQLSEAISKVSAAALPADQRDEAASMLRSQLRERIGAANAKSSALWRKISNRQEWEQFRKQHVAALRASLGPYPAPPKKLNVRISGTIEGDGYKVEKLVFESRSGLWVTGHLYSPAEPSDSMPGILLSHSHHRPKEQGELQDMGATWARAGCYVLAVDHLGHGERRQHPFASASDFDRDFAVSRQDYYFRYDTGMQLHLVGNSLMGWLAWDLMRGVDLLSSREGIDREQIILMGGVAGGGDPAGVTGALDERITCAVPFNFGGPQPETRYPLPEDAETWFNYAGSGGWESTRNLTASAGGGFLHWVIVGSIAPRRLVYGHEFAWDGERDPVWKRFERIYGFYDARENLAVAHGRGGLSGRPPEATHCGNIGSEHRKMIHPAYKKWFGIDVDSDDEFSARRETADLVCMTPELAAQLKPQRLIDLLPRIADEQIAASRKSRQGKTPAEQRKQVQAAWARVLGNVEPADVAKPDASTKSSDGVTVESLVLETEPGIQVPIVLLYSSELLLKKSKQPVVLGVSQGGKASFLENHADEIARLVAKGVIVCLPDLRGTGETRPGNDRGRYSADTSRSSTELMLGGTMVGARLRDLRTVLRYLGSRSQVDAQRIGVWGDSPADVNAPETQIAMPRRIDGRPRQSEPLGGLLAMLLALYEENVKVVYAQGGLSDFRSVLTSQFVLIPHDVVIPGVTTTGDLPELAAALAPRRLCLNGTVDMHNRRQSAADTQQAYRIAASAYAAAGAKQNIAIDSFPVSPSSWLLPSLATE